MTASARQTCRVRESRSRADRANRHVLPDGISRAPGMLRVAKDEHGNGLGSGAGLSAFRNRSHRSGKHRAKVRTDSGWAVSGQVPRCGSSD